MTVHWRLTDLLPGRYQGLEPLAGGSVDSGVVQVVPVSCCLDEE